MAVISVLLLHVEPSLLSWGHQPLLVLYSCSQGFLLYGKSALSSDWVVRGKKEKKVTKSGKTSNQYLRLWEVWEHLSILPGDMAVCIFEVLARPRVGVCVPLAFCLCHGNGLFPSYVAQGGFKAGLSAKLLRWLDPVILGGYHPTLKFSGIPTFTLIISLKHSMDNILINLQYSIKFLAIGVNVTWL